MADIITYANWIYLLGKKEFIDYILNDKKEDIYFKSLPNSIIEKVVSTVEFIKSPIKNDGSPFDILLIRYLKYKKEEILLLKCDIINALLVNEKIQIVFVYNYQPNNHFDNIENSCFTIIVKELKDTQYEIIKYVYVSDEYADMYNIKTIQLNYFGIYIEEYGMYNRDFEPYTYYYTELFKLDDNIIKNVIGMMKK